MNGPEVLRIVDAIHRDKNIDKEIVFEGIEQAILSAARKHFEEEQELEIDIDRETGQPALKCDGELLDPDVLGDLLGRVSAQTAKQVMIQKIREAERDSLYDEYHELRTQLVSGTITRIEHGACIVNLGKVEAILPRGEQIPGEGHRVNERIRCIVLDVRKAGSRVKIILSRVHPDVVRRLFEVEIPEVSDRIIEVRSLAREAGYRSKVAVTCYDTKVDAVGACVGVRGARIKQIVEELAGERIDIVRWNDSLQVLVPNGLQPAEVEDVILCPMLGKVIVLVREDQLSLAIGKKGQNVRLASKLVGWDINILTQATLDERLDSSVEAFSAVPGVTSDLAESLVSQGFFTFDDLSVIEPDQLAELGGLSAEECDAIVEFADVESLRIEKEERIAAEQRRLAARYAEETKQSAPAPDASPESATPGADGDESLDPAATVPDSPASETATTDDVLSTEAEDVSAVDANDEPSSAASSDEEDADHSPAGDAESEESPDSDPEQAAETAEATGSSPDDPGHEEELNQSPAASTAPTYAEAEDVSAADANDEPSSAASGDGEDGDHSPAGDADPGEEPESQRAPEATDAGALPAEPSAEPRAVAPTDTDDADASGADATELRANSPRRETENETETLQSTETSTLPE